MCMGIKLIEIAPSTFLYVNNFVNRTMKELLYIMVGFKLV